MIELTALGYDFMAIDGGDEGVQKTKALATSQVRDPVSPMQLRRGGGGKLSRSETVTVRLDPKLNYLCELGARAQRRTKSSFIEWAVETALKSVAVPHTNSFSDPSSVDDLSFVLWDVDEPDRIVKLAFHAPALMTHEEQVIWKVVTEYGDIWRGRWVDRGDNFEQWAWDKTRQDCLILPELRRNFDRVKQVAEGELALKDLNQWTNLRMKKAADDSDLDSDVPF